VELFFKNTVKGCLLLSFNLATWAMLGARKSQQSIKTTQVYKQSKHRLSFHKITYFCLAN